MSVPSAARASRTIVPLVLACLVLAATLPAQVVQTSPAPAPTVALADLAAHLGGARQVVIPTSRAFALDAPGDALQVDLVEARVRLVDGTARTEFDVLLSNPTGVRQEAVVLLPVPAGSVVSAFDFAGAGAEPTARLLPREEARRSYDEIVRTLRDPALLEWVGWDLVRSSVFPVEPGGTQRVRLVTEHVLPVDGNRLDYVLPRSESLERRTPWRIVVDVTSSRDLASLWSPSHALDVRRPDARHARVELAASDRDLPGAFRLSLLLADGGLAASLFAYPDGAGDEGWFLLLAGAPPLPDARTTPREVTLVLDRSGSMAGGKLDQAKAAALSVVEGLRDGESFNVIDYATSVSRFAERPVPKDAASVAALRTYLATLLPQGGTNLHDALFAALRQPATPDALPLVLFLTDGLPTVGETSEDGIRRAVREGNPHARRVFAFGVGADVNVPLLDGLADDTRAAASYVRPGEDVELAVAQVARRLRGPVLTAPTLVALDDAGAVDTRRVHDVLPGVLPDLFDGDQLVVLGRWRGARPVTLRLAGGYAGVPTERTFRFDLSRASTANAFVPRLWASRRIAVLVDAVRRAGAGPGAQVDPFRDPRLSELADEILALSTRWGILTEYTSFLATEGTDLAAGAMLAANCREALDLRAVKQRSGEGALAQGLNWNRQKLAAQVDVSNRYVNEALEVESSDSVQQLCDKAFYRRGARWIDADLVGDDALRPDTVVAFGSAEHRALVDALVAERRQALLSLSGETLFLLDGRRVLVTP
ncbi:MAG: VWA domain-containing protein [Planctomycetes bacterium]|nr:VWA domain-containing protein [Planctomycetota bacterium]